MTVCPLASNAFISHSKLQVQMGDINLWTWNTFSLWHHHQVLREDWKGLRENYSECINYGDRGGSQGWRVAEKPTDTLSLSLHIYFTFLTPSSLSSFLKTLSFTWNNLNPVLFIYLFPCESQWWRKKKVGNPSTSAWFRKWVHWINQRGASCNEWNKVLGLFHLSVEVDAASF